MTIGYTCPQCGAVDNEAEVVIDSASVDGVYSGPFESCYPGEGCEWHTESATCHQCGHELTTEEADVLLGDEVQKQERERGYNDE